MEEALRLYENHLRGRARRERVPLMCTFELTPTCNLRCRFCYVALDPYKGPYLSTEQVFSILDKLERAGVLYLTLTGGEVLSRRDFREIYLYAKRKGFLVTLFSNATMVTERISSLLAEHPPFCVEVSIYGADAEHYEKVTQIPGSFGRFVRGIELLQRAGVKLVLKTPVSTMIEDHLPEMVEFARIRGLLPLKYDPVLDARHDGGQEPVVYRIGVRRVGALHEQMDALNRDFLKFLPDKSGEHSLPLTPRAPLAECADVAGSSEEELYRCGAGRTALFVDALGNAAHCIIDREPSFSLLELEWEEVWARMGEWVTQPLPKDAPCSGCGLRSSCSNCPARSKLATGSPYLKDTYRCDLTHLEHGLEPESHPDYRALSRRPLGACAV
ncbi:MAG TPA: radical SAM protein [Gemmatimonadaceae bacterium]|nr:radical SAM protein [Gemmatimonadaceae bacterium]